MSRPWTSEGKFGSSQPGNNSVSHDILMGFFMFEKHKKSNDFL